MTDLVARLTEAATAAIMNDKARTPSVVELGTQALSVNQHQDTAMPIGADGCRRGCAGIERATE